MSGYNGAVAMLDVKARRLRNAVFCESEDDVRVAEPTFDTMPDRLPDFSFARSLFWG